MHGGDLRAAADVENSHAAACVDRLVAQATLLAALASPDMRHRVTAVSRVCTNVGFGLGSAIGGLVASFGLSGLVASMLLNAATYLAYVAVLVAVVRSAPRPERAAGGYREVIHDLPFVRLACTNAVVIAVGWGITSWIVPLYARSELGVGSKLVGLPLLANALTVVVVQVPVARLAEGRRRVGMMATGCVLFAAAYLVIIATRPLGPASYPALLGSAIAIGVGECFYTAALMPLVADLAPESLRGRYMSTISLSWWIGLALGPIAGTQLLGVSSGLTFGACVVAASTAAVSLLALDRRLPAASRLTPRHREEVVAAVTELTGTG